MAETDAGALLRDPREALETHFGFRTFLGGQAPVVSALLEGRDALVIMPTGGGKSLCYQLPALVMDGVTLVVSPLIALMKDQVDALVDRGIPATLINSSLSPEEQQERLEALEGGHYKIVYVAPERFRSGAFMRRMEKVSLSLFAVDEAHCLSQWGHDFRPDYLRLGSALEALGRPQTAAFTATATPEVRADIVDSLQLRDPFESVSGFERPNLSLRITPCEKKRAKLERLRSVLAEHRTGIVYCATRKRVEEVAEQLAAWGVSVVAYHGGMEDSEREAAQNAFISRARDVVVATNAFGMGIDRPDVRFVVHFELPGSIEAYYQEAGRAGRDGEPAVCDLLFNYADRRTQEFFIEGSNPGYALICDTYNGLQQLADEEHLVRVPVQELGERIGARNGMAVGSALSVLVRAGYLERVDLAGERVRGCRLLKPDVGPEGLELDREALDAKEQRDHAKLEAMIRLAYDPGCRQEGILRYFGEPHPQPCGNCDRCLEEGAVENRPPADEVEFTRAQKALAGVARASRRLPGGGWEGRFGKGKIVGMLVGKRTQDIVASGLDELSTHGILREEGVAYVQGLVRALEQSGLIFTQRGEYPLVTLTDRGVEVMRGDRDFRLVWPESAAIGDGKGSSGRGGRAPSGGDDAGVAFEELAFDEALFESLRETRAKVAEAEGNVPAYVVFSNQTLEFMTRLKPTSREAALRIRGIGEVKADRYLEPLLEVIRDWQVSQGEA